jgi:hypothetical protein
MSKTKCAEVLSIAPPPNGLSGFGSLAGAGRGQRPPGVKVLLIVERVEGFFLERLTDRGELVGQTQHDTLDEALRQAYSEYVLSEWRLCPDDADPLEYIQAQLHP